jgi:hypothetical protein
MLMARATSILRKDAGSVLCRMEMDNNGRGREETYRSTTLLQIELRDSAFSKREELHM